MNLKEIAETLAQAKKEAKPVSQFTKEFPGFTTENGYAVQEILLELALSMGETPCGYKMGLTSQAKQRDVQVFEPIHGFLLKSMEMEKGGRLDTNSRIHPRVEPEIAVVLKTPLAGPGVTTRDVEQALLGVYPALEIVDSRYENFTFKLADVVADNTSASGFMLGRENLLDQLNAINLMGILVKKNGKTVETGAPAAVLGDPLLSVAALANILGKNGRLLEPGKVVLTGGITNSVPFVKGDSLEICWSDEVLHFTAV